MNLNKLSGLYSKYLYLSESKYIWPIDTLLIYGIRLYRSIFQRGSLPRYAKLGIGGYEIQDDVHQCLQILLSEPWRVRDTAWKAALVNAQGRNFVFHSLIRATTGNIIELGRDRGRTLAIGVDAINSEMTVSRQYISVDPVRLDALEADFISPMCQSNKHGVYKMTEQKGLPDNYKSVLLENRSCMKIVEGFSFENEVLEYVTSFSPFDVVLFDAYWAEDMDTYEAVRRDFLLYAPLVRSGGYLLISNAFDMRFKIYKFVMELVEGKSGINSGFVPVRLNRLGIFKDTNSCLLRKE